MPIETTVLVLVLALVLEAAFGYPAWVYERIGHPVTWIGALIGALDRQLNDEDESPAARRASGVLALVVILVIAVVAGWIIERVLVVALVRADCARCRGVDADRKPQPLRSRP